MAYTVVGFTILILAAAVVGVGDWAIEHDWNHAVIATYLTGAFMIYGADWILQRTEWGRKRSAGRIPPSRLE